MRRPGCRGNPEWYIQSSFVFLTDERRICIQFQTTHWQSQSMTAPLKEEYELSSRRILDLWGLCKCLVSRCSSSHNFNTVIAGLSKSPNRETYYDSTLRD
ncbi:hypothetical protein NE237_009731 [Protea cynaroides]|uniref:Uncharacterized protein n=1 Tax=Protea cynaroides TaxID=273540 RepID=A0A9Q0KZ70_9MAGN|nr:hypothetical protein NE237_009731 [Protea cynaroides]